MSPRPLVAISRAEAVAGLVFGLPHFEAVADQRDLKNAKRGRMIADGLLCVGKCP